MGEKKSSIWPNVKPFINGGIAGGFQTTSFWLALHVYRLRLSEAQVAAHYSSTSGMAFTVIKEVRALSLRLATDSAMRFGVFEALSRKVVSVNGGKSPTMYQNACVGLAAGAFTSFVDSPLRIASQAIKKDRGLSVAQRVNYRGIGHALSHTVAEKGLFSLWEGAGRSTNRYMAQSMGMLASYKQSYIYFKESFNFPEYGTRVCAGAMSGLVSSACSLPVLNVYHVLDACSKSAPSGKSVNGPLVLLIKLLWISPSAFYKGFFRHLSVEVPYVTLTWLAYEGL